MGGNWCVALFYGGGLHVRPSEPKWEGRDRFILSKGHGCLTLYAILAGLGIFSQKVGVGPIFVNQAVSWRDIPNNKYSWCGSDIRFPWAWVRSQLRALALGGKNVIPNHGMWSRCLGMEECQEGSVWEAAMFASHHCLNNLVAVIDRNQFRCHEFLLSTILP